MNLDRYKKTIIMAGLIRSGPKPLARVLADAHVRHAQCSAATRHLHKYKYVGIV